MGSLRDRGSAAVTYVGIGALGAGAVLGLQQAGYVDAIVAQVRSGVCGALNSGDCPAAGKIPVGIGRHGTVPNGTGAQPKDARSNGWSGVGQRPESIPHLPPLPLMAGGAAVFALFWWGVPGRLRRRFQRAKPAHRHLAARTWVKEPVEPAEAAADEPEAAEPAPAVVIAGIDPGIAGKGMRVGVRECQITLRPGPKNTIVLAKTLAGTSERSFAQASRTVRRELRDPAFVASLIEQTARAATYLDGNPQLIGATARKAELTALVGALEGADHGPSR